MVNNRNSGKVLETPTDVRQVSNLIKNEPFQIYTLLSNGQDESVAEENPQMTHEDFQLLQGVAFTGQKNFENIQ